ncbi:M23 family metallopeptidase [Psychrosphaera sp. 1_MG-2023]|uniref:M23 family metallopeptidase n=1 Tax=unclassified Psychrosphaera TaxID=2641570 RepID=UPI0026E405BC|nr:M23 family metallopeptidase [Psychrosphaera sp. 1_MG-2023]MDO6720132.1 M23 family metallopeptidase [Psychrosphaera sp. 1_MG-2023]
MRSVIVWILSLICLVNLNVNAVEPQVKLTGNLIQGGLVYAITDKELVKAKLGSVDLPLYNDKRLVVFGFGRDAEPVDILSLEFADGTLFNQNLSIESREYDIDKVNGVASKYVSPPKEVLSRISQEAGLVKAARAKMTYRLDFIEDVIQPAKGRISGVYGSQRVFNGVPKRPHFGLDIAAPTGSPVVAPWSGTVVLAEPDLYYSGGTLIIDHGMGITSTYIHLSKIDVAVGTVVEQGEKIAEIGATGRVTGAHLDWRLNWFTRRLDPQLLLK